MRPGPAPFIALALATFGCRGAEQQEHLSVLLIELGSVSENTSKQAEHALSLTWDVTLDRKTDQLPTVAYYEPRKRYRADKILDYLEKTYAGYDRVIAITEADVSTTMRNHEDWGVFGLGRNPGFAAVVSDHRLRLDNPSEDLLAVRVYKVVLHEFGHTLGLPHCTRSGKCPMQDAQGKVATVDRSLPSLCDDCRKEVASFRRRGGKK